MFKLDHGGKDKEKLKKALPSLSEIQDHQSGWKDDFQLNSTLRRKFRVGYWPLMLVTALLINATQDGVSHSLWLTVYNITVDCISLLFWYSHLLYKKKTFMQKQHRNYFVITCSCHINTNTSDWMSFKKDKNINWKLLPAAHEAVMPGSDFFLNVDMLWGCIATVGDWWLYFNWCRQRRKFWPSRRRKTTPWGWGPTCPSHCCQRKRRTRNWQHCSPTRHLTVSIIYRL